jgi:hypothetical protein
MPLASRRHDQRLLRRTVSHMTKAMTKGMIKAYDLARDLLGDSNADEIEGGPRNQHGVPYAMLVSHVIRRGFSPSDSDIRTLVESNVISGLAH